MQITTVLAESGKMPKKNSQECCHALSLVFSLFTSSMLYPSIHQQTGALYGLIFTSDLSPLPLLPFPPNKHTFHRLHQARIIFYQQNARSPTTHTQKLTVCNEAGYVMLAFHLSITNQVRIQETDGEDGNPQSIPADN